MYPVVRVFIGVVITCILLLLFSNVSGFFIEAADAPHWVDPPSVAAAAGGSDGPGGPGKVVFDQKCAACHGGNGKGIAGIYPSLAGSELLQGDARLPVRIVLHGFKGKIERNGTEYNGVMTPFKEELSDTEIADVLSYARNAFGNSAPAVDAAAVEEIRGSTGGRLGQYTEAELLDDVQ